VGTGEDVAVDIPATSDNLKKAVAAAAVKTAFVSIVAVGVAAPGRLHADKISTVTSTRNIIFRIIVNIPL
jgi:hypothetical protein